MSVQQLRDEYASLFSFYDRDCDGFLTHEEFNKVVTDAGIDLGTEDLALLLEGKPAQITVEIFTEVLSNCCIPPYTQPVIQKAFKVFDKANTGKANYGELKYVFDTLGSGMSAKMIAGFMQLSHSDDSGNIDYMDFSVRLLAEPDPNEEEAVYVEPIAAEETEEECMAVIETVEMVFDVDTTAWTTMPEGSAIEWTGFYMQDDVKNDMSFQNMIIETDGKMVGAGSDAAGEFTIEGALAQDKTFTFNKVYPEWTVAYKGTMDGVTFKGTWLLGEQAEQEFEISLNASVWAGWYMQAEEKHDMELTLSVSQESVFGNGTDDVGAFIMRGTWSEVTGDFNFLKQYIGQHCLKYFGKSKGEHGSLSVRGKWCIDEENTGKFMLKQSPAEIEVEVVA